MKSEAYCARSYCRRLPTGKFGSVIGLEPAYLFIHPFPVSALPVNFSAGSAPVEFIKVFFRSGRQLGNNGFFVYGFNDPVAFQAAMKGVNIRRRKISSIDFR